jgi:hypothetical protein
MWNAMMGIGKAKENFYLGLIKKIILLIPFGMAVWQNNITLFILLWVICNYITALINMIYLHLKMHISFMKQLREILTGIMIITPFVFYFIRMDFQLPIFKIVYISIFSILYFLSNWLLKNPSVDLIISLMGDFQRSFKRILKKTNESTN